MKIRLTLLLITVLCTCVRAQTLSSDEENLPSSATMVVMISSRSVRMRISSAAGFEEYNYVEEERLRRSPNNWAGFQPLVRLDYYDLTIVHQRLDSLARRGWEIVATTHSNTYNNSDLSNDRVERIMYHFKTPPRVVKATEDPRRYTVLQIAPVAPELQSHQRGRILRMEDGRTLLLMEIRSSEGWKEFYRLEDEGPLAGDQPERITGFRFLNNSLWLDYELVNGDYTYRFDNLEKGYTLTNVAFRSNNPCGLSGYEMWINVDQDPVVRASVNPENCDPEQKPLTINDSMAVEGVLLRNFFAGSYLARSEKLPGLLIY